MQIETTPVNLPIDFEDRWEPLNWSDDFATGHAGIDADHRRLLALFNEFSLAVNNDQGELLIRGILDQLVDYTQYHFAREEQIMEESSYPEYVRHKKMHDTFVRQVSDVCLQLSVGSDMSAFLLSFLAQWLSGHILGADRKLGHFLAGRDIVTH